MEHKDQQEAQRTRRKTNLCALCAYFLFFVLLNKISAQEKPYQIDSFFIHADIKVTIDRQLDASPKSRIVCFFALPNGNTTAQTMGKKMQPGDDWHYDIQHIKAQTEFIRKELKNTNFHVVYLENNYKSWPGWKQKHPDFKSLIPGLVDSIAKAVGGRNAIIYLNGHSGGGSFIFGFLAGVENIPKNVRRISFIDSNYGYDSSYYPKFSKWLKKNKNNALNLFAYNDSIVIYNGKPLVSPTGGTWWRGHYMLKHLSKDYPFIQVNTDSLVTHTSVGGQVRFFFKRNLDGGIYHTQQVELNGFIHSVLCGTGFDSNRYKYYGKRAYSEFIK